MEIVIDEQSHTDIELSLECRSDCGLGHLHGRTEAQKPSVGAASATAADEVPEAA